MKVPVQVLVHQKTRTLELIYQIMLVQFFPLSFCVCFLRLLKFRGTLLTKLFCK